MTTTPWSIRDDLELFGIPVPKDLSVDRWLASLADNPGRNTLILVGMATVLFYRAEKDHNPKVNDIWDAMVYCSTNISVGYSDIFARTTAGKIIGSILMTIGPAFAAKAMDGPGRLHSAPVSSEMLTTLKEILACLSGKAPADAPPLTPAEASDGAQPPL